MSKINIPEPLFVCPIEVIVWQDVSELSATDSNDCSDVSESDPNVYVFDMDSESSATTDNPYKLFYKENESEVELSTEWSLHVLGKSTSSHDFLEVNSEQSNQQILSRTLLRCSHILVKHSESNNPSSWRKSKITLTRQEAFEKIEQVRGFIKDGVINFSSAAGFISDCCSSQRNGDLDIFQQGQTLPEFEQELMSLKMNRMSPIFETESGFHIVLRTRPVPGIPDTIIRKTRKTKIIIINEKSRGRKRMRKKQVLLSAKLIFRMIELCRNFEACFERYLREKRKGATTPEIAPTEEEQNAFKLKMYEEQQRRMEDILDRTLTDKLPKYYNESSTDDPMYVDSSELNDSSEHNNPILIKSAENAMDLLICDSSIFKDAQIVMPEHSLEGRSKQGRIITSNSDPPLECDQDEVDDENWKPAGIENKIWQTVEIENEISQSAEVQKRSKKDIKLLFKRKKPITYSSIELNLDFDQEIEKSTKDLDQEIEKSTKDLDQEIEKRTKDLDQEIEKSSKDI